MKAVRPSLFALLALPALALAQGSLTPPGTPAPSMKSLDQLEPRTPLGIPGKVTTAELFIDTSGSYVLMGNVTVATGNAITISARDVTLDLNGFTIASTSPSASGSGITTTSGCSNLTVRNGHIRGQTTCNGDTYSGGGFTFGIAVDNTRNVLVEDVTVLGVAQSGILVPYAPSTIRHCTVLVCGGTGLSATTVTDSAAQTCGGSGIQAVTIQNCSGTSTSNLSGIEGVTVTNCSGESVSGCGIYASDTATNCRGLSTSGNGLLTPGSALNCTGTSSSNYGVNATSSSNCIGISGTSAGLTGTSATGCQGYSTSGIGLYVTMIATNCYGSSTNGGYGLTTSIAQNSYGVIATGGGTSYGSYGLAAYDATNSSGTITAVTANPFPCYGLYANNATNSSGSSPTGYGLAASFNATNCSGTTATGSYGLYAWGTASFCRGINLTPGGGVALYCTIAVACTSGAGTIVGSKQLGTL